MHVCFLSYANILEKLLISLFSLVFGKTNYTKVKSQNRSVLWVIIMSRQNHVLAVQLQLKTNLDLSILVIYLSNSMCVCLDEEYLPVSLFHYGFPVEDSISRLGIELVLINHNPLVY